MKIFLVIATTLWCVSVLSHVNATVIQPRGPLQGNPEEAVPEPLKPVNEPLGVRRVRRQSPTTIPCGGTTWTVTSIPGRVQAEDTFGDTVTAAPSTGNDGPVQCESDDDSTPSVTCTLGEDQGHAITMKCVNGLLQVGTNLVINEINFGMAPSPSNSVTFRGNLWTVEFLQTSQTSPPKAQIGTSVSTVKFASDQGAEITYAAIANEGGNSCGESTTTGYDL